MAGGTFRLARVGFTADLGYECWFEPGLAKEFMRRVEAARSTLNIALPGYGLSALQACRLEGGFVVAGWDFSTELDPQPGFERSPYDIGLGWLVNLDAGEFVGRDALLEQKGNGHQFNLRGFELDKRSPPQDGTELYAAAGDDAAEVGIINCSSWSWGMGRVIGNASIKSEHSEIEEAWFTLAGKRIKVKISRGPFINLERRNQVPVPTDYLAGK